MHGRGKALIWGSGAAALGCVAVLVYVGIVQAGDMQGAIERAWRQRASDALDQAVPRARRAWTAAEDAAVERARSSDPRGNAGFVVEVSSSLRVVRPVPWPDNRAVVLEVQPDDMAGEKRFAQAQAARFARHAPDEALRILKGLDDPRYSPDLLVRVRLTAGAVAADLGQLDVARNWFLKAAATKGVVTEVWHLAAARSRAADQFQKQGDPDKAKAMDVLFIADLLDRDPGQPLAFLTGSSRRFFIEQALSRLEETDASAYGAAARAWLSSQRRDRRLAELRARLIPRLVGARDSDRVRVPLAGPFESHIAVMQSVDGGWQGAVLRLAALGEAAQSGIGTIDPGIDIRVVWETSSPTAGLGSVSFLENAGLRLDALPTPADAVARHAARRRLVLWALLAMAGVFLITGTVLLIRRLQKEMDLSRLKTDLLSQVSHDFRTPLSVIRCAAETLSMKPSDDPDRVGRYSDVIVQETQRLNALVEDVLESARVELGRKVYRFGQVDLAGMVRDVDRAQRPMLEQQGFSFDVVVPNDLPPVRADHNAMQRALYNLIDNSAKYSGEAKAIELRVRMSDTRIEIAVSDRGRGIPPELKSRVLERFYRVPGAAATATGAGLGLALVAGTVQAHGGSIAIDDREGGGTTVTLHLPRT